MTTMNEIEAAAGVLAVKVAALNDVRKRLNDAVNALVREELEALTAATDEAAAQHKALVALIDGARGLFERPKSVVFHGIRVGLKKSKGRVEFDDEDKLLSRIRRLLPDQEDALIATSHAVVKDALAKLPADVLKKLGVSVVGTGDVVLIKQEAGIATKMIDALIKGIEQADAEPQQEAA